MSDSLTEGMYEYGRRPKKREVAQAIMEGENVGYGDENINALCEIVRDLQRQITSMKRARRRSTKPKPHTPERG